MTTRGIIGGGVQQVHEIGNPAVTLVSDATVNLPLFQYVDFFASAALGLLPGVSPLLVLGTNSTLPTSEETLWSQSNVYPFPTTQTVATIVSSSASDEFVSGIGAKVVEVVGVDTARNRVAEVVLMDGENPVNTLQQFFRINSLNAVSNGSNEVNVGNITATVDGGIVAEIPVEKGFSTQGVFSPEVDENVLVTSFIFDVGRNDSGTLSVKTRFSIDGGSNFVKSNIGPVISIFQGTQVTPYPFLLFAPSGLFIDLEVVTTNTGSGSISVTGGFNAFTFTDAYLAS